VSTPAQSQTIYCCVVSTDEEHSAQNPVESLHQLRQHKSRLFAQRERERERLSVSIRFCFFSFFYIGDGRIASSMAVYHSNTFCY